MAKQELVNSRVRVRVSSSIENFKEKALERVNYNGDYTLFIGLYHWVDYLKFIFTRGKITLLWCGSDILVLNRFWAWVISHIKAQHLAENDIERDALYDKMIAPVHIQPVILTDPDKYPMSYKHSDTPHVYMNVHPGREKEYGLNIIERVAPAVKDITRTI